MARRLSRPLAAGLLTLFVLLLMIGCGRAIDRPARGAAPGAEAAKPPPGLPPTLTASESLVVRVLPSPSPSANASPSPVGSPSPASMPPIVRTIAPPADGTVPQGAPVALSAVLVGRGADLAAAQLFLNGADIGGDIDRRTPRDWTIRSTQSPGPGTHTARVLVRDTAGGAGGFTWRFTVGSPEPPPAPEEEPRGDAGLTQQPRVGVLGGGALGLGAALRLAQGGAVVTLLEREPQLGGLAAGFRVGPNALEKFYHHIFKTDTTIIRFIHELGLSERLIWGQPTTSVLDHGRITSLGSIPALLRLPLLPPLQRARFLAAMAVLKAIPNERFFGGATAASWMPRLMGRHVYDVMWEPVLRGKFGARADEIAMSWLWSRVHERSLRLGYVRGGFQLLYDALGARITSLGGTVVTGVAATAIRREGDTIVVRTDTHETYAVDRLLVTLPTRLFARLASELPAEFIERYPGPEHYGAHVVILGLDRPLTDDVYWLNINDRDLPFLALVEHTNFMPPSDYGGLHLIYLGNYLPMDDPLFGQSDGDVLARFLPALRHVRDDFEPGWVRQSWVFKAPFAQPIVTTDYLSRLPPHRTPLPGVYLANMAHVYPQDRGQNYSLRLGERMARTILDSL